MANFDPALHAHLQKVQLFRDRATELIGILNSAPMTKMTRDDLKTIESIEQRALPKIEYSSYRDRQEERVTQIDVERLEALKFRLFDLTPA